MAELPPLTWRAILLVGAAYGVFAALVSYWFTLATGLSLWTLRPDPSATFGYILAMNLWLWSSWALFAPAVFALSRRFRIERDHWRRALAVHLAGAVVVTVAHIVVGASGRFALQTAWGVDVAWAATVREAFFRTLDFELPVYWALVGIQHAFDYYREARTRELGAAQLETRLVEAQLQALERQLHPHFLFNTLHAISALVRRDPDRAEEMVERLSVLLRITLDRVGVQEVPLREELDHLRAYLDIEQVHFGDRLQVTYAVEPYALDALVPNLILQPLAENAVRHGLEPRRGPGRLEVAVGRQEGRLQLSIADNGGGLTPTGRPGAGIGLSNTRARLARLYGDCATLELTPHAGGGLRATITLPFRIEPAPVAPCPSAPSSSTTSRWPASA